MAFPALADGTLEEESEEEREERDLVSV